MAFYSIQSPQSSKRKKQTKKTSALSVFFCSKTKKTDTASFFYTLDHIFHGWISKNYLSKLKKNQNADK